MAFSGWCDCPYLLAAAVRAGCDVKAYGVRTAFQPAFEIDDARRLAAKLGADFELIDADVLARDEVCANGPDRCYRCKAFIFSTILERMARDGYEILADGTNATDDPANRPGFQALAELGVTSPLRRAGMTKEAVRAASRDSTCSRPTSRASRAWPCTCRRGRLSRRPRSTRLPRLGVEDGKRPVGGSVGGKRPVGDSGSCEARNRPGRFVLETDRLLLRQLTRRDFAALCTMLQDDEVMYAYEGALSDGDAQAWLDRQLRRYARDGFGLRAVVLKETGELIGQCGLTLQDVDAQGTRGVEVGYLFCREFWHRGFATEAALAHAVTSPSTSWARARCSPSYAIRTSLRRASPSATAWFRAARSSSTIAAWTCRTSCSPSPAPSEARGSGGNAPASQGVYWAHHACGASGGFRTRHPTKGKPCLPTSSPMPPCSTARRGWSSNRT